MTPRPSDSSSSEDEEAKFEDFSDEVTGEE
jgi:hypothetical protein